MFMPGFVTRNEQRALRASRAYCDLLGTPWECLDARDRVLRERPPDVASAAQFAAGACKRGSARGCVLWAEALGCGRGVAPDVKAGLSVLRRQCEQGPQACLELAIWLDYPGARAALGASPAKASATYEAAQIALTNGRVDRARELVALLPKQTSPWPERRAFLEAMIALARGEESAFQSAVAQLRTLKPDERVTRILGRIAASDRSAGWMPSLISAWSAERKPELTSDLFLLPSFEPQSTCIPGEREVVSLGSPDTVDGFLTRLAHRFHAWPRPPPPADLLEAARLHAAGPDEGVRLAALALMVEPFLGPEQREQMRPAAAAALEKLAEAHRDDAYLQLASLAGPDAGSAPVDVRAVERLERIAQTGTLRLPGRLLRETLRAHLRPDDFQDFGLSTAVEVVLDIDVERYLERVLNEAGEPERRLAVVRTLGWQLSRSGWLVELFTGTRILSAVADRTGSDPDKALAASTLARGQRLWSNWTVFPRLGRWPFSALADELRVRGFEDEVGVLERYAAMGAE
jgi:TPR repeat protein